MQDFFHQQYEMILKRHENLKPRVQRIAPIIARIEYKGLIFGSNFGITFYRNLTGPTFGDLEKPLDVKMGCARNPGNKTETYHAMVTGIIALKSL